MSDVSHQTRPKRPFRSFDQICLLFSFQGMNCIYQVYTSQAFCTPSALRNPFLDAHRMQSDVSISKSLRSALMNFRTALKNFFNILKMSGSRLLSHIVSNIVPSAARIFTVVFGMGTGVASARIATRQIYQCFIPLI